MTQQEIFSYRLSNIRKIRARTLKQVSAGTGFTQASIFNWERSEYPSSHTPFSVLAERLAEYFQVPANYFLECDYTQNIGYLLLNPYLDYWVWSGEMTYEKAKELQEKLPDIL